MSQVTLKGDPVQIGGSFPKAGDIVNYPEMARDRRRSQEIAEHRRKSQGIAEHRRRSLEIAGD